jgi:hypothetical protein
LSKQNNLLWEKKRKERIKREKTQNKNTTAESRD